MKTVLALCVTGLALSLGLAPRASGSPNAADAVESKLSPNFGRVGDRFLMQGGLVELEVPIDMSKPIRIGSSSDYMIRLGDYVEGSIVTLNQDGILEIWSAGHLAAKMAPEPRGFGIADTSGTLPSIMVSTDEGWGNVADPDEANSSSWTSASNVVPAGSRVPVSDVRSVDLSHGPVTIGFESDDLAPVMQEGEHLKVDWEALKPWRDDKMLGVSKSMYEGIYIDMLMPDGSIASVAPPDDDQAQDIQVAQPESASSGDGALGLNGETVRGDGLPYVRRAPTCSTGRRFRALYGYDQHDNLTNELRRKIHDAIFRVNGRLWAEAKARGSSGARYKFGCNLAGKPQIAKFRSANANTFAEIVEGAKNAGFSSGVVKYIIFWDGNIQEAGKCGEAYSTTDDRKSVDNLANNYNQLGQNSAMYATLYRVKNPDGSVGDRHCWGIWHNYYSTALMHEMGHMMGATQATAPHYDSANHCSIGDDVMCYQHGPNVSDPDYTYVCQNVERYDCTKDMYFNPTPASGSWLSYKWNQGQSENLFLSFP